MRRVWVQIHLWIGIGLGLYVVMMSLTGSAIVARRELQQWWVPEGVPSEGRPRLSRAELLSQVTTRYPGYEVLAVSTNLQPLRRRRDAGAAGGDRARTTLLRPVEITLRLGEQRLLRRFDPATGRDLGEVFPPALRALLWLVDLHDNLLGGRTGRLVNGLAAVASCALLLTGIVIWWPAGARRWRDLLWVRARLPWRSQFLQLHNALGFWLFLLLLLWAAGGVYFAFPEWFQSFSETVPHGDAALTWLSTLHFGRFGGWGVRIGWIVMGLAPAALFITGASLWWLRVVRPKLRAGSR